MAVTAALVKELRERTSAPMMDCKKALDASGGDIDAAIEAMRASGQAKAVKKAGRVAAEGKVMVKCDNGRATIMEANCETDFVARDANFEAFSEGALAAAFEGQVNDVDTLMAEKMADGQVVDEARLGLVTKIGENIQVRRVATINTDKLLGSYLHGLKIGVVVELDGGDDELAKDIAMHVAASKPLVVLPEQVPEANVEAEKKIFIEQARESGKPDDIIEKMITGRVKKFLNENALVGQAFVKDPSMTVGDLLKQKSATVANFIRYEVGEGVEKKEEDFAAEVMAQVKGSE